jgi:hypothetical protein
MQPPSPNPQGAAVNANERKTVLVVRRTRLDELVARYHTLSQARFYIELWARTAWWPTP